MLPLTGVSGGRLHVDFFIVAKFAIEVGAIEVEGVGVPVVASGDGEDDAKAGKLRNGGESVEVIHAELLRESLCDEACFVLFDSTVGLPLDAKDPFASDDILVGGSGNVDPGSHTFEGADFTVHGLLPFRPVCAGLCFFKRFGVILKFGGGRFEEGFRVCEISIVAVCKVVGVRARVTGVLVVRMHIVTCGTTGGFIKFFACCSFSMLDCKIFCCGVSSTR